MGVCGSGAGVPQRLPGSGSRAAAAPAASGTKRPAAGPGSTQRSQDSVNTGLGGSLGRQTARLVPRDRPPSHEAPEAAAFDFIRGNLGSKHSTQERDKQTQQAGSARAERLVPTPALLEQALQLLRTPQTPVLPLTAVPPSAREQGLQNGRRAHPGALVFIES